MKFDSLKMFFHLLVNNELIHSVQDLKDTMSVFAEFDSSYL